MDSVVSAPTNAPVQRTPADRRMRRLLFLPEDAPKVSIIDAQNAFSKGIAISAVRCLFTYIFLPLLRPLVDLSGGVGPVLGLAIGAISAVAIIVAMRRFFAADHKWRWGYATIGGGILVLVSVQGVVDLRTLFS
jgi:hypothetical protein